jgi:hypothetical protein
MRLARLNWIAAILASLGAMSCTSAAKDSWNSNPDGASFDAPPAITCSNDSSCGSGGACVANRCVSRAPNLATWAIEIDPPLRSGSQLTELPSLGSATLMITASSEFELTIPLRGGPSAGTALPTSAGVVVSVPSQIPGRPDLSFQSTLDLDMSNPASASARVKMPDALRGRMATVSLIPLPPSDEKTPPHKFTIPIPLAGQPLFAPDPPATARALRGLVLDAINNPKVQFTARAFWNGALVSTAATTEATMTNAAGNFVLLLPVGTGDDITLELAPFSGTSDPWVTYPGLSLTEPSTDLGTIKLPAVLKTTPFQVTIHGGEAGDTPVSGATVRAYSTLEGGDARVSARFVRDGISDSGGTANMSLMPGDTNNPRPYTLSVVPPAGSMWATQCFDNVPAQWPGTAPVTLLRAVMLPRRAVITGSLLSASGVPVANARVAATGGDPPMPRCLAGPSSTSTTTDATGSFTLPLDPGTYQLEFDPPPGSPFPRMIESGVKVTTAPTHRVVRLPTPVLVEGEVLKAPGIPLPDATVRIFEPRPTTTDPGPPFLRAATQTDANGRFRAIVAAPSTN